MRLIDADALFKVLGFAEPCSECDHVIGRFCADQIWADVCDAIIDAPTIDTVPVTSWVTDRHPPFGENVLITFATGEIGIGDYRDFVDSPWYADGQYFGDEDIVAWMPLPEPWEEEEDETD